MTKIEVSKILLNYPVKDHSQVTQRFGENPAEYLKFGRAGHNGIDFGVPAGSHVNAADAGVVEKVGSDKSG